MHNQLLQRGFTLIEMIVSVAIFSIVATVAVGALLILIGTNQQLQVEQNIMTNLSFALDSMTREIRTGTNYYCASRPNYQGNPENAIFSDPESGSPSNTNHESLGDETADCASGNDSSVPLHGISFVESGNSITGGDERILYFFDEEAGSIYRRVGDGSSQSIVSSGLDIVNADFFVTGSTPGDTIQPTVTIVIEAREVGATSGKTYTLQTTVVQRALDI